MRYQNGTLERMARKNGPDIWTYRWVERTSGKRRRVQLGTVKELRNMKAVKLAADGYRLTANSENDVVRDIAMSAVLGFGASGGILSRPCAYEDTGPR